ncbi:S1 RNA-binding domain-containing protein, partial [Candidatus Azambacteria bacterium]|nr:S1 RNA-binding domain-containing protein [Candidatus Azambacteria bacterium]
MTPTALLMPKRKIQNRRMTELLHEKPQLASPPKLGDIVEGLVLEVKANTLYLDLGAWGTGIVYGKEFQDAASSIRASKPGDAITGKVVDPENTEGYVELSLREAGREKTWERLREFMESGEAIETKILEANRGGLLVEIEGVKGFLPVSQLASKHYPRVEGGDKQRIYQELIKFVGSPLTVKVIDVDPREEKLIVSEREAENHEVVEALNHYAVGDVISGEVSGVVDFGAFVKFGPEKELEGLVHISELDHRLIDDPRNVVKVGDGIEAKIIGIERDRISLSVKALKQDPWEEAGTYYKKDDEVEGEIVKVNP